MELMDELREDAKALGLRAELGLDGIMFHHVTKDGMDYVVQNIRKLHILLDDVEKLVHLLEEGEEDELLVLGELVFQRSRHDGDTALYYCKDGDGYAPRDHPNSYYMSRESVYRLVEYKKMPFAIHLLTTIGME